MSATSAHATARRPGRCRQPAAHPPAADLLPAALRLLHRPQGHRQAVPVGGAALPAVRGPAGHVHPLAVGLPGQKVPLVGDLLLRRSGGVISPAAYNAIFTMHGLVMIFFAITPLLIGAFGNFTIPLMIGARDMAFPRLNMLSFWTFVVSLVPGRRPPSSSQLGSAARRLDHLPAAVHQGGHARARARRWWWRPCSSPARPPSWGRINYVITVIRFRAPGHGLHAHAADGVGAVADRRSSTSCSCRCWARRRCCCCSTGCSAPSSSSPGRPSVRGGGDPILFQHLFWIFGHPEVYILILPAWGFVGDLVAFFSRKPAYWYKGSVVGDGARSPCSRRWCTGTTCSPPA